MSFVDFDKKLQDSISKRLVGVQIRAICEKSSGRAGIQAKWQHWFYCRSVYLPDFAQDRFLKKLGALIAKRLIEVKNSNPVPEGHHVYKYVYRANLPGLGDIPRALANDYAKKYPAKNLYGLQYQVGRKGIIDVGCHTVDVFYCRICRHGYAAWEGKKYFYEEENHANKD